MESLRCKMVVKAELGKMQIAYKNVESGEAELGEPISDKQHNELKTVLFKSGLELMDDKKAVAEVEELGFKNNSSVNIIRIK